MQVEYNLMVDFARPSKTNSVLVSENDADTRVCRFTLMADKQPLNMTEVVGATIAAQGENNDAYIGSPEIAVDEDGNFVNEITYTIPKGLTEKSGTKTATITLIGENGKQLTSFEFYLKVRNSLYKEDDFVNADDLQGFRELLNKTQEALKTLETNVSKDALPNQSALRVYNLDGRDYDYIGKQDEGVDIHMGGYVAYIDNHEEWLDEDAVDESAALVAVRASESALASKESAEETLGEISRKVEQFETTSSDSLNEMESLLSEARTSAETAANHATDAGRYLSDMNALMPRASVSKDPETSELILTVSDIDGETSESVMPGLDGKDGASVSRVVKTKTEGITDTYSMYNTDDELIGTFTVKNAGDGQGGSLGASTWADLQEKPFESVNGTTFEVVNGALNLSSDALTKISKVPTMEQNITELQSSVSDIEDSIGDIETLLAAL